MIGESGANGYFRCTTTVAAWPGRPDSGIELASTFFHETIEKWRRGISMNSTRCICQDIDNQPLTVRTCTLVPASGRMPNALGVLAATFYRQVHILHFG
jgi:hypothetical protein